MRASRIIAGWMIIVGWMIAGLSGLWVLASWLPPMTIRYAARELQVPSATVDVRPPVDPGFRMDAGDCIVGTQIGLMVAPKFVRWKGQPKVAVSMAVWPRLCRRLRVQVHDGQFPLIRWSPKGCEHAERG